ncbi:hypothetical protein K2X33_08330 [bacterium]|nr:hypothetical protein [bacterium]
MRPLLLLLIVLQCTESHAFIFRRWFRGRQQSEETARQPAPSQSSEDAGQPAQAQPPVQGSHNSTRRFGMPRLVPRPGSARPVTPPTLAPQQPARGPSIQATSGALSYFNPLPYPEKYRQCEEKYLTNKCLRPKPVVSRLEIDPMLCSSDKVTAFGYSACFAKAHLDFEHCMSDLAPVEREPKCVALGSQLEPNLRKAAVQNCNGKVLTSCPHEVPLDVMQCETDITKLTGDATVPPLRLTQDDACTTASRMAYTMCLATTRPSDAVGKELKCRRVERPGDAFSVTTVDRAQQAIRNGDLSRQKTGRYYVDFSANPRSENDYRRYETCLVSLFGRQNVTTFPQGHDHFVVLASGFPLERLLRSGGICRGVRHELSTWDGAAQKGSIVGPREVTYDDSHVVGSDW